MMDEFFENDNLLAHWLLISNKPVLYMHQLWRKKLQVEGLFDLYHADTSVQFEINKYVFELLSLATMNELISDENKGYQFWIEHFLLLKAVARLIGLILMDNPEQSLMMGNVYRQITEVLPIKSARLVVDNYRLLAGPVKSTIQEQLDACQSTKDIDEIGGKVLINAVCPSLKDRVKLLFKPNVYEKALLWPTFGLNQQEQVIRLIKQIIRFSHLKTCHIPHY